MLTADAPASPLAPPISIRQAAVWILIGTACFHAAYSPLGGWPILGYALAAVQLARLPSAKAAFRAGVILGWLCFGPQLFFFWHLFGRGAPALWTILALWLGLFTSLAHAALVTLSPRLTLCVIPVLWTGLEYTRSELYPLCFSWLDVGFAFANQSGLPFRLLGFYGIGLVIAAWASWVSFTRFRPWIMAPAAVLFLGLFLVRQSPNSAADLKIAGAQLEAPSYPQIQNQLAALESAHPEAQLLVFSEYTLDAPPPVFLRDWCRTHQKYVAIGGVDPLPGTQYFNTVFGVDPTGNIVFRQAKSVPVQFFHDGLPAPSQQVWNSPWGKLGFCICYDLSYRRVVDRLIEQGARALIVPTMDAATWGSQEHELHTRVAKLRAAEYGLPIFRIGSSGISQFVDASGREVARAPFPGRGAMIAANLPLQQTGHVPLDHWLAPIATGLTALFVLSLIVAAIRHRRLLRRDEGRAMPARKWFVHLF